jgi:hypothetical protein
MAKHKSTLDRKGLTEALERGEHVGVGPNVHRRARELPPVPAEGDDNLEGVVIRDAAGKLTHAGMEWTIQHGGGVMIGGQVITRLDDLPSEAELARGNEAAEAALAASLDAQIAALSAQRASVGQGKAAAPATTFTVAGEDRPDVSASQPGDVERAAGVPVVGATEETPAPHRGKAQHKRSE